MVPSPLALLEAWGDFSDICYKRIVKFLEVQITIWWGTYNRVPWGFYSQRHSHWADHPTILEFQFRISCPCSGCCPGDAGTSCICVSLQLWWQHLSVSPFLRAKNCWFFSVFSFSLVSMKWWLSSSFHVELESGQFFVGKYFSLINACKSVPLTLSITRTDPSGPAGGPCSLCPLLFIDSDHSHSLTLPYNLQASSAFCITWNILSHPWASPCECTKVPNFQGSKLSFREVMAPQSYPNSKWSSGVQARHYTSPAACFPGGATVPPVWCVCGGAHSCQQPAKQAWEQGFWSCFWEARVK